jgi:hypothetical protein
MDSTTQIGFARRSRDRPFTLYGNSTYFLFVLGEGGPPWDGKSFYRRSLSKIMEQTIFRLLLIINECKNMENCEKMWTRKELLKKHTSQP